LSGGYLQCSFPDPIKQWHRHPHRILHPIRCFHPQKADFIPLPHTIQQNLMIFSLVLHFFVNLLIFTPATPIFNEIVLKPKEITFSHEIHLKDLLVINLARYTYRGIFHRLYTEIYQELLHPVMSITHK